MSDTAAEKVELCANCGRPTEAQDGVLLCDDENWCALAQIEAAAVAAERERCARLVEGKAGGLLAESIANLVASQIRGGDVEDTDG